MYTFYFKNNLSNLISNMIGRIKKVGAELLFNGIIDGNIHDVIAMLDAGEVDVNSQNFNG